MYRKEVFNTVFFSHLTQSMHKMIIISAHESTKHSVVSALDTKLISGSFGGDIGVITLFSIARIP